MIAIDQSGQRSPGRIAIAIAGTILANATVTSTASLALPRYDGLWSVSIVTEKGDCDRGYRYPVRISSGTLANGGDSVFTISGRVGGSGAITVTLSAGGRSATGSGRARRQYGRGLLERRRVFRVVDGRAARIVTAAPTRF